MITGVQIKKRSDQNECLTTWVKAYNLENIQNIVNRTIHNIHFQIKSALAKLFI